MPGSAESSAMRASQHALDALGQDEHVLGTIVYRVADLKATRSNSN